MKKKAIIEKQPEEFPAVVDFLDAKAALDEFKQLHASVFEELTHLVDRYNATREQAEKVVRASQTKCGPFDAYQVTTKYNAQKLYALVGREVFLEVGGSVGSATTFDLDKGRFEAAITSPNSKIKPEVLEQVKVESVNYHVPEPLVTP